MKPDGRSLGQKTTNYRYLHIADKKNFISLLMSLFLSSNFEQLTNKLIFICKEILMEKHENNLQDFTTSCQMKYI